MKNSNWRPFVINQILKGSILLNPLVNYVFNGIDNHSFDTNSPELIQETIDDGRIKPFPRERRTDSKRK